MVRRKYIVFVAFIFLLVTGFTKYYMTKSFVSPTTIDQLDLELVNKLMIVAHPDDEILWGGGHLIEDNYLVVCITCGRSRIRVKEFKESMAITNDRYIMLDYPDSFLGIKSKWSHFKTSLSDDLKTILDLKKWNLVVTHNPDGEYGHIQHKITSNLVTSL
jgi:LmbE family N-acetylglucosaminyl deacetylase